MKEKDWREEVISILEEHNKFTSLPSKICSNPMKANSVKDGFWHLEDLRDIKRVWNRFKENIISEENFLAAMKHLVYGSDNEIVCFLCLLLLGKYMPLTERYLSFLENLYISGGIAINYWWKIKMEILSPAALILLQSKFGMKKARKIKQIRDVCLTS